MASNALRIFPCGFPSILRRNLTSCFSISSPRMTRRVAVSISCMTETGEKQRQPLEEEPAAVSLKHFFEQAKELVTSDVGPPHWFTPSDCGHPLQDSPLLLFLPGIDGTGLGLIMHHQKLGKIFDVLCLHIPPKDRTPFADLVKLVEKKIRSEHDRSPDRPIYIVGESLGACLALSVASDNHDIDLVLILANPATSFSRSPLQPLLPLLQLMPDLPNLTVPPALSIMAGVMMDDLEKGVGRLLQDQAEPSISYLSVVADILPIETLLWKLQMLDSASSYANLHLHAVKAETLILSSGKDPLLPSQEEGQRLGQLLANCLIRTFEDCGHFLFLADAFDLVTVIKQVCVYRRSKERDFVSDYIPPSPSELIILEHNYSGWNNIMSPVMLSTLANGKIVRSFAGIPSEGPVLHTGVVPVSGKNLFKLLSADSHVLLFPGGGREALHRKGEAYKLFWPERSEFVRMAARFGAKIIPFSTVGEDDICDILFDYDDQIKIPLFKKYIDEMSDAAGRVRATTEGEVANQPLHLPTIIPKVPGRLYYLFGKPIETKGRKQELRDKKKAHELYLQVKSEVDNCLAYLLEKRESDPNRSLASRMLYQATNGFTSPVPTFDLD